MDMEQILSDIEREKKKTASTKYIEAKNALANTVFPLLEEIVEWVAEELDSLSDDMDDLVDGIDEEEEAVGTELTFRVIGLLGLAAEIVSRLDRPDHPEELRKMIDTFNGAFEPTVQEIKDLLEEESAVDTQESEQDTEDTKTLDDTTEI
jgi:hypothetical protein